MPELYASPDTRRLISLANRITATRRDLQQLELGGKNASHPSANILALNMLRLNSLRRHFAGHGACSPSATITGT